MNPADVPLVIWGPTASGKSSLALHLAELIPGVEIVSVDSMQVYKGMDIGTATPTTAEQAQVPHHLINFVDPFEDFAVTEFQDKAHAVLADLRSRAVPAILVGGTVLYMRAVIDNLTIPGQYPEIRAELEAQADTEALHARLAELDPQAASRMEPNNRRRVIRALEVTLGSGKPFSSFGPGLTTYPPVKYAMVGLRCDFDVLDERIESRFDQQMRDGLLEEVKALPESLSRTAAQALGYRDLLAHLRGEMTLEEAREKVIIRTRQFARRQMRWLKRDPRISWMRTPGNPKAIQSMWDIAAAMQR